MGLLSKLTGYFSNLEEKIATQDKAMAADDFGYEHEEEIDKWVEKIEDAERNTNENPDSIVTGYKRAIKLCHDFELYCASFGPDGAFYYEKEQLRNQKIIEQQLQQYLDRDYENDKKAYAEEKAQKAIRDKPRKDMTKHILKAVSAVGQDGVLQKTLLMDFSEEDKRLAQNCINALVKEGKLIKGKSGGSVLLTTK